MRWGIAATACLWLVLRAAGKMPHPIRAFLSSALCGLAALGAINVLSETTGVLLPCNAISVFCGAVLGIPGIILLLVVEIL